MDTITKISNESIRAGFIHEGGLSEFWVVGLKADIVKVHQMIATLLRQNKIKPFRRFGDYFVGYEERLRFRYKGEEFLATTDYLAGFVLKSPNLESSPLILELGDLLLGFLESQKEDFPAYGFRSLFQVPKAFRLVERPIWQGLLLLSLWIQLSAYAVGGVVAILLPRAYRIVPLAFLALAFGMGWWLIFPLVQILNGKRLNLKKSTPRESLFYFLHMIPSLAALLALTRLVLWATHALQQ